MSVTSRGLNVGANKAVKIRRLVNGKWQKEIVRDPAVVNAYLRQRRLIEEQEPLTGDLAPTDDPELNARRKKACVSLSLRVQCFAADLNGGVESRSRSPSCKRIKNVVWLARTRKMAAVCWESGAPRATPRSASSSLPLQSPPC